MSGKKLGRADYPLAEKRPRAGVIPTVGADPPG